MGLPFSGAPARSTYSCTDEHLYTMSVLDIAMPTDFASEAYDSVYERLAAIFAYQQPQPPSWPEYSAAWQGLAYRFQSCDEHDQAFTESINRFGVTPPPLERYRQERELFGFFVTGLSSIECICYSLFSVGSLLTPDEFPLAAEAEMREVSPGTTLRRFRVAFANESVTHVLAQILGEQQYHDWKNARNVLSHRSHPGRNISVTVGGPPHTARWAVQAIPIDVHTTASRRKWLASTLGNVLKETDVFTANRF